MLPKENTKVNYCRGTNCYKKQNQLEARLKRAEAKKNKIPIMLKCTLEGCNETFEKNGAKKFHSKKCQLVHNIAHTKEKIKQEVIMHKEGKKQEIDLSRFTSRGKIHYEGLGNI